MKHFDGLLMFSGGLDSTVAAHLLISQGLSILAVHYVLPFYSGIGNTHSHVRQQAEKLGLPLHIEEEGDEFLAMVRSPHFGFGKNANPCLDCRMHRLKKTKLIMEAAGASFIATGEVIGQRPMSQRLSCLQMIEKRCDLTGRLLRPLSARQLAPTVAEEEGLVDRDRLLRITGRSRQPQIEYARKFNLEYPSPAGGCILTNEASSRRYLKLEDGYPDFTLEDFKLIAYGRHFAFGDSCRLIVARDDKENDILEKIATSEDTLFDCAEIPGPLALGRGSFTDEQKTVAAGFVARYGRARNEAVVKVRVYTSGSEGNVIAVSPASPEFCDSCRI